MIRCQNCDYFGEYTGKLCPACKAPLSLSEQECRRLLQTVHRAKENKEYETVEEGYRILAEFGVPEGMREYAKLLEQNGEYDGAMRYFGKAAKCADGVSAYRYGKLLSRYGTGACEFYTLFAAMLGAPCAYREAGEILLERSEYAISEYYYRLAADAGDVEAIVTLARRYAEGIGGTEMNESHAKWFLDKLRMPPIHALRLAYRLRAVTPSEPPAPVTDGYTHYLLSLFAEAGTLGLSEEAYLINETLAERGDPASRLRLALLQLTGDGCEKDPDRAEKTLILLAEEHYAPAILKLAELLLSGEHFPIDKTRAHAYLRQAADLGCADAYRMLGDLYSSEGDEGNRLAYAITLYDEGARLGDRACAQRREELKARREHAYRTALQKRTSSPEDAFRLFAISAAMGYTPAEVRLGDCYLFGTGTSPHRRRAYLWYKNAAKHGEAEAYYPLGMCYSRGVGTRFDYRAALDALRTAEGYGSERAGKEARRLLLLRLKKMKRSLYSAGMRLLYQKKFELAHRMIRAAADMGDAKAKYTLAAFYEFGIGAPEDRTRASLLYAEADAEGFADPRARYKSTVLKLIR